MRKNIELRDSMYEKKVAQWEVAKALGFHESVFSRKLREELPPEEKEKILAVIENLAKEENA